MGYLFIFLLIQVFDPSRLLGGDAIWDITSIMLLVIGCLHYSPLRAAKMYYTPLLNAWGFWMFSLFLLVFIISLWRSHSFLNTQLSIIKNTLSFVLIPLFLYCYYQYKVQKSGTSNEKIFMLIIHVLGIFCLANLIAFIVNPSFGSGSATIPRLIGISTKSVFFPLYPNLHPNSVGVIGGFLMVLSIGYRQHISALSWIERIVLFIYACTGFAISLMGDSRGTLFGAMFCIIFLTILMLTKKHHLLKYSVLLIPFSHILFILSLQIAADSSYVSRQNAADLATGNSRKYIYRAANAELSDFKPVHLVGFGEYGIYGAGLTRHYMGRFGYEVKQSILLASVAHNTALQAIFDVGYLGLFVYLLLLFIFLTQAQQLYESGQKKFIIVYYFLFYHIIIGTSETHFGNYHPFLNYVFVIMAFFVINAYNVNLYKLGTKEQ